MKWNNANLIKIGLFFLGLEPRQKILISSFEYEVKMFLKNRQKVQSLPKISGTVEKILKGRADLVL